MSAALSFVPNSDTTTSFAPGALSWICRPPPPEMPLAQLAIQRVMGAPLRNQDSWLLKGERENRPQRRGEN